MESIVIFGPAHVGKSTLVGFLASFRNTDTEFNRNVARFKKLASIMGISDFDKMMVLPSFVALDKNELIHVKNSIGTTKRIHHTRVLIPRYKDENIAEESSDAIQLLFIDTPGTRLRASEKYKGIFKADAGIFMVDAEDILNHPTAIEKYKEPLQFWQIIKPEAKLIICISKIDRINKETYEQDLKKVKDAITDITGKLSEVPIVPISVILEENNGWYIRNTQNVIDGRHSLCAAINRIIDANRKEDGSDSVLLSSVDKVIRVKGTNNYAVRQKILNGEIKTGDNICIEPVRYGEINKLNATVKTLKIEEADLCDKLQKGWIGGAVLSSEKIGSNRTINYDRLKIVNTSILYSQNEQCKRGRILLLRLSKNETSETDWSILTDLYPKESIGLFWFGKRINMELIHLKVSDDYVDFMVAPLSKCVQKNIGYFILPEKLSVTDIDVMLSIQESVVDYYEVKLENRYFRAELLDIRDWAHFDVHVRLFENMFAGKEIESFIEGELKKYQLYDNYSNYNISIEKVPFEQLGGCLKKIRTFLRKNYITDYYFGIRESKVEQ